MRANSILSIILFGLLVSTLPAGAATLDTFQNYDYDGSNGYFAVDQVYLFLADGGADDVTFEGWNQAPSSRGFIFGIGSIRWDIDIERPDLLSASGDAFGTWWWNRGRFSVDASHDSDFTMEFAFLLDGSIVDSGSAHWNAGLSSWTWSDEYASTIPNPIGGTAWLLGPGLLALAGLRRRKRLSRR